MKLCCIYLPTAYNHCPDSWQQVLDSLAQSRGRELVFVLHVNMNYL